MEVKVLSHGGIGNQLFQLKFALRLALVSNNMATIDTYYHYLTSRTDRPFQLPSVFPGIGQATNLEIIDYKIRRSPIAFLHYSRDLLRKRQLLDKHYSDVELENVVEVYQSIFAKGYYQSYDPRQPTEKKAMQIMVDLFREFNDSNKYKGVVGVHARRGDYLFAKHSQHGIVKEKDLIRAAAIAKEKHNLDRIVVFSDDLSSLDKREWLNLGDVEFSRAASPIHDLKLMATCEALICSNSTFSWWAGHLGEIKNVYIPSEWFIGRQTDNLLTNGLHTYKCKLS